MRVGFARLARDEYNDAVIYYELQQTGLGKTFKAEIRLAIQRMLNFPRPGQ